MEDRLTAQDDHGSDISSYPVRGLGLMVQFRHHTSHSKASEALPHRLDRVELDYGPGSMMIPSSFADKLAFGMIPGDARLGFDDVVVATDKDCLNYISSLYSDEEGDVRGLLKKGFEHGDITKTGIDQLMPIISPCLVIHGCKTVRARIPNRWCNKGVLNFKEGFTVFRNRITELTESGRLNHSRGPVLRFILEKWKDIEKGIGPWEPATVKFKADVEKLSTTMAWAHSQCTDKLLDWKGDFDGQLQSARDLVSKEQGQHEDPVPMGSYPVHELMRQHLLRALGLREKARRQLRGERTFDTYGHARRMSLMFSASGYTPPPHCTLTLCRPEIR